MNVVRHKTPPPPPPPAPVTTYDILGLSEIEMEAIRAAMTVVIHKWPHGASLRPHAVAVLDATGFPW